MTNLAHRTGLFPSSTRHGLGLMLLSAILFVMSWPALGEMWFTLLIAFVPLFWLQNLCLCGEITRRQLLWFIAGAFFLWNTGALYFLFFIDKNSGMRMLVLFTPVMINTIWMTFSVYVLFRASLKWGSLFGQAIFVMSWLVFEYIQHHWTLAFPWLTLGNVLGPHPEWMQWYAVAGVGGGSLWILLVNVLVFRAFISVAEKKRFPVITATIFLVVLVVPPTSNFWFKPDVSNHPNTVRFTVVQPCLRNTDQKFELAEQMTNVREMLRLANSASDESSIVVLPETAIFDPGQIWGTPPHLQYSGIWVNDSENSEVIQVMRNEQREMNWPAIITGAFASKLYLKDNTAPVYANRIPEIGAHLEHYNSAAIVTVDTVQFRHKTVLVAGVERIPFADVFPFLNNMAVDFGGVVGTLGSAEKAQTVQLNGCVAGVQICYDSAFGWLSRKQAQQGAQVLVVLTNDSWWGDTPGYKQLLSFAQIRAVETGKPVVRCANNGISAFIAANGTITNFLPWNEQGALSAEITPTEGKTFYTRMGDWVYYVAIGLLPLLIFIAYTMDRVKQSKAGERLT